MKLLIALLLSTVVCAYADGGLFCSLCTELITSLEDELQDDEPDIVKKANEGTVYLITARSTTI
jgi:hypothetical protein